MHMVIPLLKRVNIILIPISSPGRQNEGPSALNNSICRVVEGLLPKVCLITSRFQATNGSNCCSSLIRLDVKSLKDNLCMVCNYNCLLNAYDYEFCNI